MKPMPLLAAILTASTFSFLPGCSNPADNVPAAAVDSATNAPTETASTSEAGERYFAFGTNSSSISFVGSKVTGSHNGGFRRFAGELKLVNGQLAGAGNKVLIDMTSTWADNDRLTGHLKSPDFFNAPQFPTTTFVTTAIEKKETNSMVTGNLTLHGITKQISFPATVQVSADSVELQAQFVLNRFDFEIKYPGKANDLIRKEVVLKLAVKAAPGRADFSPFAQPGPTATRPPTSALSAHGLRAAR